MHGSVERSRRPGRHPAHIRFYASVAVAGILAAACGSPVTESAPRPSTAASSANAGGGGGPVGAVVGPETTGNVTGGRGGFDGVTCDGFTTRDMFDSFFELHTKVRAIGNIDMKNIYSVSTMWPSAEDVGKGQMLLGLAAPGDILQLSRAGGYGAVAISVIDFTPVAPDKRPKHTYDVTLPLAPQFKNAVVIPCDNGGGTGNVLSLAGPADE